MDRFDGFIGATVVADLYFSGSIDEKNQYFGSDGLNRSKYFRFNITGTR